MYLSDVQKKKTKLEKLLYKEISLFEEDTGLSIYDIELYRIEALGRPSEVIDVTIEVRL